MATLVNKFRDSLQGKLIVAIYDLGEVEQLMGEPEGIALRRAELAAMEAALRRASTLLSDTRALALPGNLSGADAGLAQRHAAGIHSMGRNPMALAARRGK